MSAPANSTAAFEINTAPKPSAEPMPPNSSGMVTCAMLLTVTRMPAASLVRPAGAQPQTQQERNRRQRPRILEKREEHVSDARHEYRDRQDADFVVVFHH